MCWSGQSRLQGLWSRPRSCLGACDPDEANELTERIMILASSSVLQQIDSLKTEIRAYKESTDSKIDAQKSRSSVLIWVVGVSASILSLVIALVGLGSGWCLLLCWPSRKICFCTLSYYINEAKTRPPIHQPRRSTNRYFPVRRPKRTNHQGNSEAILNIPDRVHPPEQLKGEGEFIQFNKI